jgi:hypothetical protein
MWRDFFNYATEMGSGALIYCHVLMVVTIDGVGLTTGFIGLQYSYTQLQYYSRPSHKATLHSLQWQRLLSLCSTALSPLG